MSREALHESLSAVMDNEADELEIRRVLAASGEDEMRSTWSRYQVARAALHKELIDPRLDIAAAVSAAIADEAAPAVKARRSPWRSMGRLAVAASVTVAVLAGVRLYNQDDISGQQLAQPAPAPVISVPQASQAQGPAVLAGYSEGQSEAGAAQAAPAQGWHEQRLPSFVRQHAQQAAFSGGSDSALPFARAASMEER
ncbi:RNA polymerase subunit sigma [Stutzerimonas nosocomialis]|uniref:RseA family anti-sigma factor n=1 Tax=Stutzerimonas nosocomialis TaxID=1056496 RepID=UPI0011095D37|nr:RseA family anti-sigma factor [Stutzerimonas nosocomialis]TLX58318.1 RNA polymerase subunit sigma [Stutzerimonas nosocomialis]